MSAEVDFRVDGRTMRAAADVTVAAALLNAGIWQFRTSVQGDARGPVCGMGVCFECRVTINGTPHRRACLVLVEPGMDIVTHD